MTDHLSFPTFTGTLADFVTDLRTWVFPSQNQAAQHFALHRSTISRYEEGRTQPAPGYLAGLLVLYRGSPADHHTDD